ncbi:MAG TPA: acyl-CoA thioesterase domain-containing protein [Acidimicrobiales bacterium]|nr:acyl-CoA thioesterase domain-containing protein [Acidimicrobiales bacterium]
MVSRSLAEVLSAPEQVGEDRYRAETEGDGFLFGGLTLGLALRVGCLSVSAGLVPRSLHTYFTRAGHWGRPLDFEVTHLLDGRSVSTRLVTVSQGGRAIATMTAAFHRRDPGETWQRHEAPEGPDPDRLAPSRVWLPVADFLEVRPVGGQPLERPERAHPYWCRPRQPLGEDPATHACAIAFVSDYLVILAMHDSETVSAAPGDIRTLDHSLWFHRHPQADDWLLYSDEALSVSRSHGVSRGTVVDREGNLVASFVQGDIIRTRGSGVRRRRPN